MTDLEAENDTLRRRIADGYAEWTRRARDLEAENKRLRAALEIQPDNHCHIENECYSECVQFAAEERRAALSATETPAGAGEAPAECRCGLPACAAMSQPPPAPETGKVERPTHTFQWMANEMAELGISQQSAPETPPACARCEEALGIAMEMSHERGCTVLGSLACECGLDELRAALSGNGGTR